MSIVAPVTVQQFGLGYYAAGEDHTLIRERRDTGDGRRLVLCLHGRGGDSTQFNGAFYLLHQHLMALVAAGYTCLSISAGGPFTWGNDAAMAAISSAVAWAQGSAAGAPHRPGAAGGKIAVMGWSMGGLNALNWVKRNPSLVSSLWCWAPALNLGYFRGVYAEVNTAYGGAGSYPANAAGHDPYIEPNAYQLGLPIRIGHATDDPTVPFAHSNAFVSNVARSYVTLRPTATGGHNPFATIPTSEVVSFIDGGAW